MTISVSLDELIDALEEESESQFGFLDRETGEIHFVSEDALSLSEPESESETDSVFPLADWQKEEVEPHGGFKAQTVISHFLAVGR